MSSDGIVNDDAGVEDENIAHMSWKVYDDRFRLSELLTDAARACVFVRAHNPGEFLAAYFTEAVKGDAITRVECSRVISTEGVGLRVCVKLYTHIEGCANAVPLLPQHAWARGARLANASNASAPWSQAPSHQSPSQHPQQVQSQPHAQAQQKQSHHHSGTATLSSMARDGMSAQATASSIAATASSLLPSAALSSTPGTQLARQQQYESSLLDALLSFIQLTLTPALKKVGVCNQSAWDDTLSNTTFSFHPNQVSHGEVGTISNASNQSNTIKDQGDPLLLHGGRTPHPSGTYTAIAPALDSACLVANTQNRLPRSLCFALSVAAALAASKVQKVQPFQHLRAVLQQQQCTLSKDVHTRSRMGSNNAKVASDEKQYILPQLLIPFFGHDVSDNLRHTVGMNSEADGGGTSTTATATAANIGSGSSSSNHNALASSNTASSAAAAASSANDGVVWIHTIYILPGAAPSSVFREQDINTQGSTGANVMRKDRVGARTNSSGRVTAGLAHHTSFTEAQAQCRQADSNTNNTAQLGTASSEENARNSATSLQLPSFSPDAANRLFEAFRLFARRHGNPAIRPDGAFVYEAYENISDAVELAVSVLMEAGLLPMRDFTIGIRIHCPVVSRVSDGYSTCSDRNNGGGSDSPPSTANNASEQVVASDPAGKDRKRGKLSSKTLSVRTARKAADATSATTDTATAASLYRYALFPGDADVTSAQVAEYVRQQVIACHGWLTFVEDSHAADDHRGGQRMRRRLADLRRGSRASTLALASSSTTATEAATNASLPPTMNAADKNLSDATTSNLKAIEGGVFHVVHALRCAGDAGNSECRVDEVVARGKDDAEQRAEQQMQQSAPRGRASGTAPLQSTGSTVMIDPQQSTVLSEMTAMHVGATGRQELRYGSSVGLVCATVQNNVAVMIDLAMAVRARYVEIAGLMNGTTACEALTRYVEVQHGEDTGVKVLPATAHAWECGRLNADVYAELNKGTESDYANVVDEEDENEPVPEIKRKGDKKKRKGNRHL